ncbi:GGDEF domain-containing protein [Pantoea agglomerans]|uniref:GGDEF domain-containing protein n=1 Tax=Enterobacter agglomerans TaxID=549 RepID=UPI0010C0AD2E|nr:GGDEF domain-containing protein [Pantoea agglomerans]MBD8131423.1 GGDEF domain-containing protein [Pantoea agglomerans]MBD8143087.1 GGDEF domain-containing protein [Pantoea agglomerans]MBD8182163.1 GGDEF domain-containing protein [Pantoea agglomerans]MBD8222784.1 GGDEF domain-containing protein [Pantoea agglomerans]TKJ55893.1 GGDEF domain-containing protein [Pantoea agglomerans]
MDFNVSDKLIHELDSPKGLLYRMIFIYTLIVTGIVLSLGFSKSDYSDVSFYFIVNFLTIIILAWFIRKSFNIHSHARHLLTFRAGVFLLLNSTIVSMAGGLRLLDKDNTSIIAATLYAPAILLIIYSFNKFIYFANDRYKSAVDLSLTDELTGLPNRRHLNMKLRELEANTAVICIIDLDDFKKINDSYGHEMGDKVLKNAGLILQDIANDEIFISRSGGEEFAVIIHEEDNEKKLIEKIKHSLCLSPADGISTKVSIGVTFKSADQTSSSSLAAADAALYESKRNGKNRTTYSKKNVFRPK